jgi:orotidine-5'-phosphate decarboxylase
MLTLHASGGRAMLRAAVEAAKETADSLGRPAPLLLGVTVLTSLDEAALAEIGWTRPVAAQVERLALLAVDAGLPGLVCSPLELRQLRKLLPPDIQLVTPGIRPATTAMGDQKRVMAPTEALAAGASWLVIGRPITAAPDPVAAARAIGKEIQGHPNGDASSPTGH